MTEFLKKSFSSRPASDAYRDGWSLAFESGRLPGKMVIGPPPQTDQYGFKLPVKPKKGKRGKR